MASGHVARESVRSGSFALKHAWTWLLACLLLGLGVFVSWRLFALTQADRWMTSDPERSLRWAPDHPQALLSLAERQLSEGHIDDASVSARHLLQVAPLEGRGFRILAEAAAQRGDSAQALILYQVAGRRSPRDLRTRAWLIQHFLDSGDYPTALGHIDVLLRSSPGQGDVLMPLLAQLAVEPVFAADLTQTLKLKPPWRAQLLTTLQQAQDPLASDAVLALLKAEGELSKPEFEGWITSLIHRGSWQEAYARWVSTLDLQGEPIPLVYNGDFEKPVSNQGFDWHQIDVPGVWLDIAGTTGTTGLAAHAVFRGRQAAQVGLEQPLLLAPGQYRFKAKVRADSLQSERGLQWSVTCRSQSEPLAISEPIQGSFGWRSIKMDITIPTNSCAGQWLRLDNPVPAGSIQQVSGELWFDDVTIKRVPTAG